MPKGALSYTVSPVDTIAKWVELGKRIEDMGSHSICIKDMAGLLAPYVAYELVSKLKETLHIPIHMQCHATTGMSTAAYVKAVEAGVDNVDTAISSMSMTYGHSATESMVAILQDTDRATGLDMVLLEEIADYFREVRKKYAKFEGSLKGVDARIILAQVPGGMLTNLESQLREQGATRRMAEVLAEIPRVREDLGFIPLVTPTSQIVGSQARHQCPDRRALQVDDQGDRRCSQGRVRRDLGTGEQGAAGEGSGGCRTHHLSSSGLDRTGDGEAYR